MMDHLQKSFDPRFDERFGATSHLDKNYEFIDEFVLNTFVLSLNNRKNLLELQQQTKRKRTFNYRKKGKIR